MVDRQKLAKVLALLNSPHDGEVLAAARAASAMVAAAGSDWSDLLAETTSERRRSVRRPDPVVYYRGRRLNPPYGRSWRETVIWLLDHRAARFEHETYLLDKLSRTSIQSGWPASLLPEEAMMLVNMSKRVFENLMHRA